MMRRFAWCGTTRSISSIVWPVFASTSCDALRHRDHRALEDLLAVEIPRRVAEHDAVVGVGGPHAAHAQDAAHVGVAAELLADQPFLAVGRLQHHGRGAVAEQHRDAAVASSP